MMPATLVRAYYENRLEEVLQEIRQYGIAKYPHIPDPGRSQEPVQGDRKQT
jgi:hypothetical protein